MKRFITGVLSAAMLFCSTYAANIKIDGKDFSEGRLIDSVTYVPIRSFSEKFSRCDVTWEADSRTAKVKNEDVEMSARIGDGYMQAAERYIYTGNENRIIDGKTYVPIRSIAKILGAEVVWDDGTKTVFVNSDGEVFLSADEFYNENDLFWLSKIISAESAGESLEGKIAVGNVVLNRVESDEYPDTVYEVIFDKKNGVQFTPVMNGTINNEATEESKMAAKICLENYRLSKENILFFLNPEISTSTWVPDNRDFVMTIGRHDFYA